MFFFSRRLAVLQYCSISTSNTVRALAKKLFYSIDPIDPSTQYITLPVEGSNALFHGDRTAWPFKIRAWERSRNIWRVNSGARLVECDEKAHYSARPLHLFHFSFTTGLLFTFWTVLASGVADNSEKHDRWRYDFWGIETPHTHSHKWLEFRLYNPAPVSHFEPPRPKVILKHVSNI